MRLLDEGQIINSVYEVERFLGSGAFAEVYRVRHKFLGRQAMKVFKMIGMTMSETESLLSEAALLSSLGHPNIVRVFDANTTQTSRGNCGFFTMEYVAGGTLERFWRSFGTRFVPVDVSVDLLCQICRGLSVAHSKRPPIIHRDLKPQNILVGYDGTGVRARVSDFGLARHVNPLTLAATTRGTRTFKPPEALRDPQSDSCASDAWALGTILYLMLTDNLPYTLPGEGEISDDIRFRRRLSRPSQFNLEVDPSLDEITARALTVDPRERYQDAREFLEQLTGWVEKPVSLKPPDGKFKILPPDKSALGSNFEPDDQRGRKMIRQAVEISRHSERLTEASDLMEEALNLAPHLRDNYGDLLKLWRRGIVM